MTNAVNSMKVPALIGSIVIVGVSTRYTLLYSECDLNAAQMNIQCSLIQEHAFTWP